MAEFLRLIIILPIVSLFAFKAGASWNINDISGAGETLRGFVLDSLDKCHEENVKLSSKTVRHEYSVALNLLQFPDSEPGKPINVNHSAFISGCDGSDLQRIEGFLKTMISKDWKDHQECKMEEDTAYKTKHQNAGATISYNIMSSETPKESESVGVQKGQ